MFWYQVYAILLKGIAYICELFDILVGAKSIVYKEEAMTIYTLFFRASPVSTIFWGVTLVGMALAALFSFIAITRRMADLKLEKTLGQTLGQIGRTMLNFLITPFMILALFQLVTMVMTKTDEMFYSAYGGTKLDTTLFVLTARDATVEDASVLELFASGVYRYDNEATVTEYLVPDEIMSWLGIPLSILIIVLMAASVFILAVRIFLMIILYIVSPFFVSSMVLDDGAKYKTWREAIFARLFSGFTLMLAMKVLVYLVVPFLVSDIALAPTVAGDIAMKCLFAGGAVFGMYKSSMQLVKIIAPRTESDDAMVFGFLIGAVKSAGRFAVNAGRAAAGDISGLAKQASGAIGGVGGGGGSQSPGSSSK